MLRKLWEKIKNYEVTPDELDNQWMLGFIAGELFVILILTGIYWIRHGL